MKKLFNIFLITLSVVLAGSICSARTISADELKILVEKQIKHDMRRYEVEEIEVNISNMSMTSIELPDGNISLEVTSNSSGLNPKEYKKVSVFVDRQPVKIFYLPVEIKAYKTVATAKDIIQRDQALSYNSIEFKKVDVIRKMGEIITEDDISKGLVAKKLFSPGEIISKTYTAPKPNVLRNAIVVVDFHTDSNLVVSVQGIALCQGHIGDVIQVKNKKLNRIYTGRIVGENKVLIEI